MNTWPRWIDILLGVWLILSPSVLEANAPASIVSERILGAAIIALAAGSLRREWDQLHFLSLLIAVWLIAVPYFLLPRPGPALAQSDITVGFTLLMTGILPTRATEPPGPWRNFRR